MPNVTVSQLIAVVRKPGKIRMPVVMSNDVTHITIEKADLIDYLFALAPDDSAPWAVYGQEDGVTTLDVQDDSDFD